MLWLNVHALMPSSKSPLYRMCFDVSTARTATALYQITADSRLGLNAQGWDWRPHQYAFRGA